MNAFTNSFNPKSFAAALNSAESSAQTITRDIFAAHVAGKAGLALILSAVALVELTKPKLNMLRVACFRARKANDSKFTLAIDTRKRECSIVETASIARKAGAGRKAKAKSTRAKPDAAANVQRTIALAHDQRDTALASAKYLAAALSACGLSDERIAAIGKGTAKAATVRAWVAESLAQPIVTGKRQRTRVAAAA